MVPVTSGGLPERWRTAGRPLAYSPAVIDGGTGRRGRRWPLWIGLGLVLILLVCSVPVVVLVTVVERLPNVGRRADASASPTATRQPADPAQADFARRLTPLLEQQAAALLRGDERGFLAVADPSMPAVTDLRRQFRALRAMKVTVWRPNIRDSPVRDGGAWRVTVTVEHCFVVPNCEPGPVTIGTRWADVADRPRLIAVEPSRPADEGPRPWEVSDLVVAVGDRALVATTKDFGSRLPQLLDEAEQAAIVADRYAVDGSRPDRYRIFYAGEAEWERWYGGGRADWTAGYAVAVGGGHYEVVLNSGGLHHTVVDDLLRHELTHAASLPARGYASDRMWWLVEGLAEYAAVGGRSLSRYDNLPDVRRLIRDGGWDGRLDSAEPRSAAAEWEVGGRYGIGYLAVRHLVNRFGEQRMLDFFKAVVHDRGSTTQASWDAFGEEWSALHDECVSYVRAAAV